MNFDCSCLWVRDAEPLKEALSLTPHFLRAKGNALDYKARGLCTARAPLVTGLLVKRPWLPGSRSPRVAQKAWQCVAHVC